MYNSVLTAIFLFCINAGLAQSNILTDTQDFKDYPAETKVYCEKVFEILSRDDSNLNTARYTVLTSVKNEYSFSLKRLDENIYISSTKCLENFENALDRNKVKWHTQLTSISEKLYMKIRILFRTLTIQLEPVENDIDYSETSHYFSYSTAKGDVKRGELRLSDNEDSPEKLIEVCQNIYLFGRGKTIAESELIEKIDAVLVELEKD